MDVEAVDDYKLEQIRFTRDFSCFTSCGEDGCRLFSVDPLSQLFHATTEQLGCEAVLIAEHLRLSNIVAMVCKKSEHTLKLWDYYENKAVRNVPFPQEVTDLMFHHDRLLIALRTRIILLRLTTTLTKLAIYETGENLLGILAVNCGLTAQVIAFPGAERIGTVKVVDLQKAEPHCVAPAVIITAHEHELACLTLNTDGTKVASASKHGTLIRIFDAKKGEKLMELRRGSSKALVYSLNFSPDSGFLCAASDKGTVHIFAVFNSSLNKRSALSGLATPYSESQWGLTNFTLPSELPCICSFMANKRSNVVVVCMDGTFHIYKFSADASTCRAEGYERFIDLGKSSEM